MSASVVVPTRDRPEFLRGCLRALRAQDDVGLDVVVVDDGGADVTAVAAIASEHEARLLRVARGGPAAARNAGVEAASGAAVIFLDDDCLPCRGWARALTEAVEATSCVAAGRTLPPPRASAWLRGSEQLATQAEDATGFFRTLGLACPRALALAIPFDPDFRDAAGEDRDWCSRVARSGVGFVRVDGAAVEHCADGGAAGFARQQLRWGAAVTRLRRSRTHVAVPLPVVAHGIARTVRHDPAAAGAMVAGLALTAAGFVVESLRPTG